MERAEIVRISPVATRSCHETVVAIDLDLVEHKAGDARRSTRRREIHAFHEGDADPLQRMLNALQPGSYVRPHRHLDPPRSESLVVLQGTLAYLSFHDDGTPGAESFLVLGQERSVYGCDIRPRVWHMIFALVPDTVIFEAKPGPYSPTNDKDFAPWAPPEGTAAAAVYLARIEDAFRRLRGLPPRSWQVPA
ncbi:MAG: WbuC family cupin fold metalloprotein [Planctomycetes bacterium]|jgi:cupin fold WbuC family metalloprotein|nr:WbuC family cupin fold metalloprotein [Planctomycetota bacterium]